MSITPLPATAARRVVHLCLALALLLGAGLPVARAGSPAAPARVTLILDFVPNAVHAGIYHALAAGYFARNGLDLTIIQPTSTSDTLRLIAAGKADFGIADGIDVAGQIDLGRDAQAIMALVQRPLGGLITLARSGITSPRGLEGKTIGITGVPSDTVMARTIVEHAGGSFGKVHIVTIGFNGVPYLEHGSIAAFIGFWPADGVQAQVDGYPIRTFKLDEYGGPTYPGLVVFSTRGRIVSRAPLMRAFVAATVRGYQETLKDPARSLSDLLARNPVLSAKIARAQLTAYMPLFQAGAAHYGLLDAAHLAGLSAFLLRAGLIRRPITPARYGTNRFLPGPAASR